MQRFEVETGEVAASVIAVTGAGGFMGRAVTHALLHSSPGVQLRVLVRDGGLALGDTRVHMVPGDVTDADSVRRLVAGADTVVHLAGVAHTHLSGPTEFARAYGTNVDGTLRLMDAAADATVQRIILMSSAHVYRGQHGVALTENSPTEQTDKAQQGDYAAMKLLAERAAKNIASTERAITVLRPCLVYGTGARANLHSLMRAVRRGFYVHPGGADALRSFVSVETVAAAVVHALGGNGGTFNLADREPVSLSTWVNHLADRLGAPRPRTVPVFALRAAAAAGSVLAKAGAPAPLTLASLRKLTADFSLDVSELEHSGFVWPGTDERVLQEMAADFLAGQIA